MEILDHQPHNSQSLELTRLPDGETTKFEVPLFLPNIFSIIQCNVSELRIDILDFNRIKIKINFQLVPDREIGDELYNKDSWKIISSNVPTKSGKPLAPLILISTNPGGVSNTIKGLTKYGEGDIDLIKTSYSLRVWLPHAKSYMSTIDAKDMPEVEGDFINAITHEGKMAAKKNDVYWGELNTKFVYSFSFSVESSNLVVKENGDILMYIGFFLPYKKVSIENFKLNKSADFSISEESILALQTFGEQKQYLLWETPLVQNFENSYHGGYLSHNLKNIKSPYHYDEFLYSDYFLYLQSKNSILCNLVCESDNIVSAYFNCFKDLYDQEYSPIVLIITNTSLDIRKVKVMYEIKGYSETIIENKYIEPLQTIAAPLLPTLDEKRLSEILEHSYAQLNIKIYQDNSLVFEESKNFNLLPKETFVFDNEDNGKSKKLYFYSLLARWVTPNIPEVERIISEVTKAIGIIEGDSQDISNVINEIKGIYDAVAKHVKYGSRTFSLFKGKTSLHQKVYLPSNTLKNGVGNCMDLTVLMASCLEKIGYKPQLIIVPEHAFLGIKLPDCKIYIETTCLGYDSFDDALENGNRQFEEHFIMESQPKKEKCIIVDVSDARKHNIYPMN